MIKFCKKCQAETERYVNGRCGTCQKVCAAAYRANNRDKANAASAVWKAVNPEKSKAAIAAWAAANPEKRKAASAAWKTANPERKKDYSAAWKTANPEATRIHGQNREARKRINGGILSGGLSAKLFKLQRGLCPCCNQPLGTNFHLDHILPISQGGPNLDWNMQLLRQRCNNQKHAKHPIDFMQQRGFLL